MTHIMKQQSLLARIKIYKQNSALIIMVRCLQYHNRNRWAALQTMNSTGLSDYTSTISTYIYRTTQLLISLEIDVQKTTLKFLCCSVNSILQFKMRFLTVIGINYNFKSRVYTWIELLWACRIQWSKSDSLYWRINLLF